MRRGDWTDLLDALLTMVNSEVEVVIATGGRLLAQFAGELHRAEEIPVQPDDPLFLHVGQDGFSGLALSEATCGEIYLYEPIEGIAGASIRVALNGASLRLIQRLPQALP